MEMISEIRRFSDEGNSKFVQLISERPTNLGTLLQALADDPTMSTGTPGVNSSFEIPTTRFEVGKFLHPIIGPGAPLSPFSRDAHMWNWISARMFSHLIPDYNTQIKLGQTEKWALSPVARRYYRHLFAGPYFAFEAHSADPSAAMSILFQPIRGGGEIVEQIQGTDEIAYSVCCAVATKLYYSSKENKLRKGSSSKGAGSVRRLTPILNQFLVTMDLKGMAVDDIIDLLPPEFDAFKFSSVDKSSTSEDSFESSNEIDDEALLEQIKE